MKIVLFICLFLSGIYLIYDLNTELSRTEHQIRFGFLTLVIILLTIILKKDENIRI